MGQPTPVLTFEAKITRFLAAACRQLRLEVGILARITGDEYQVVAVHTPDDSLKPGDVFSLPKTYCERTIRSPVPVGFHHARETDWKNHPAYEEFELEAYIGARVAIGDQVWGTVNFSSLLPRPRSVTDVEKVVVQRIAEWAAGEIHNLQKEAELVKALQIVD